MHGQDRRYHHPIIGLNGRLDTIQAAVLLAKLPSFADEVAARERRRALQRAAARVARVPVIAEGNSHVYAQYTIEVDDREAVQAKLKELGVPTAVHYRFRCICSRPSPT